MNQLNTKGEKDGYWEEYWETNFGSWRENYHPISSKDIKGRGNYINGDKVGYWEWYHSNGNLMSKINYTNGKRDVYCEHYSTSGKLMYKGNYVNREFKGLWEYYCEGELMEKVFYVNI